MDSIISSSDQESFSDRFTGYVITPEFWLSIAVLIAAVILWKLLTRAGKKWKSRSKLSATGFNVGFDILRGLFIFIVIIVLLQVNGINITALLTGLGVASAIIGLALQDFLKDIIMGIHILIDKFFLVGDVVKYKDVEGEVISFNIRTTKIKFLTRNEIMTISNRNISEITVLSDLLVLNVNLPYYVDAKLIHDTLRKTAADIEKIDGITKCEYKGTGGFNESSITYKIFYYADPGSKYEMERAANMVLQDDLKAAGIPFAYNHLEVEMYNRN